MTKSFEYIKGKLIDELKAKYLEASIEILRLQAEYVKPKEMGKAQAGEMLGNWQKHLLTTERKLERYRDFDVDKIKEFDI